MREKRMLRAGWRRLRQGFVGTAVRPCRPGSDGRLAGACAWGNRTWQAWLPAAAYFSRGVSSRAPLLPAGIPSG